MKRMKKKFLVASVGLLAGVSLRAVEIITIPTLNGSISSLSPEPSTRGGTFRGDVSPANSATYTINRSGVYKLTCAQSASGMPVVSITANNVTLDLGGNTLTGGTNGIEISGNNVTVKNGSISGASQSGVLVVGDGCRIEKCDLVSCTTGITLQNSHESVVYNCHVRNAMQAGISLVQSFTNSIIGSTVNGITNLSGDVYGCIATNGGNNIFNDCFVSSLQTYSLNILGITGGFILKGNEDKSQLINCACSSITSSSSETYGFACVGGASDLRADLMSPLTHTDDVGGSVYAVSWLVSGTKKYLASGGAGINEVSIFEFDEVTQELLSVTQSPYAEGTIAAISWLESGAAKYLATGGQGTNEVSILKFDEGTESLLSVTHSSYTEGTVLSVSWLISGTAKYLATGGQGTNEVSIFEFDESAESLRLVTNSSYADGAVGSVSWLVSGTRNYLASGGFGTNSISLFEFDELTESLLSLTHNSYAVSEVLSVDWLDLGDKKYLAAGGRGPNEVSILEFNEATNNLSSVTHSSYSEGRVMALEWFIVGEKTYIVAGADIGIGGKSLSLLEFNAAQESLLSVTHSSYQAGDTLAVAVLESGGRRFLASGGRTSYLLSILEFQAAPHSCSFENNRASDVHSSSGGKGFFLATTNHYVAKNTVYDCDLSFDGLPTQYITSQANDRGAYNIDTASTTPDTVNEIITTNQTIQEVLSNVVDDSWSVQSKLDVLALCEPSVVTSAGTLSTQYGSYCLANDITGQLSITGTGITFCLNGHTITANRTNALTISGKDVIVKNGTVRNAIASGVKVTGDNCTLQNIASTNNVTGFEFSGSDGATVTDCRAINNTREGYLITDGNAQLFDRCHAFNTSGAAQSAGFKSVGGSNNRFENCDINGVASSASEAYGMLTYDENSSVIAGCSINDVHGTQAVAGIGLMGDSIETPTVIDFSYTETLIVGALDWLNLPMGSYLSLTNRFSQYPGTQSYSSVLSFSPIQGLSYVTKGLNFNNYRGYDVCWLSWNNNYYLAESGQSGGGGQDIKVYIFDPGEGNLTYLSGYEVSGATYGIDWLVSGSLSYLAFGAYISDNPDLGIFRFDEATLTRVAGYNIDAVVQQARAFEIKGKHFVAYGWFVPTTGPNAMQVYSFDDPQGSENLTLMTTYTFGTSVSAISSFEYGDTTFLTVVAESEVKVFEYDELATTTLTLVASLVPGTPTALDALTTGSTVYLAVALTDGPVKILKFDPYALTLNEYNVLADSSTAALSVKWNRVPGEPDKIYLAFGFSALIVGETSVGVVGFTLDAEGSKLCLVEDNVISDVLSGAAVLGDPLVNGIVDTTAYGCKEGFVPAVSTSYEGIPFDTSNRFIP